jgi:hypothetical protein
MNKLTTRLYTFISVEDSNISMRIFICDLGYNIQYGIFIFLIGINGGL